MLDNALVAGKNPTLEGVIPDIDFTRVTALLEGITSFNNFKPEFDNLGSESDTIKALNIVYTDTQEGIKKNTEQIVTTLSELN